jgi:membrane protein
MDDSSAAVGKQALAAPRQGVAVLWARALVWARKLGPTLRDWPWFDTLRTLRARFRDDRLGLTAGSLTFTTLIALVPLVTVMLAVFTAFPMFAGLEEAVQKYFLQNLVPDSIAKPVMRAVTQFAAKARGMGTAGLVLLVVTALALVLTIDRTLNAIWRVRQPRPLAQRVLVYWAALTLGPLALGVSLSITSVAVSASRGLVQALPGGVSLLLDLIQFALLAAGAAGLFHTVPNTAVRWAHAWAGGVFVAVAFEVAKKGLAWYLETVPSYNNVYGAFATVPILMLWVYLGWVIVLLGAVIAAYAPSLQMRVTTRPATAGWRFELALAVLQQLHAARTSTQRGLSLAGLAEHMRADPLQLEPVLDLLCALDWVQRLDEQKPATPPRYVLLCDPAATELRPLLHATLLQPGPATTAFLAAGGLQPLTLAQALGVPLLQPAAGPGG